MRVLQFLLAPTQRHPRHDQAELNLTHALSLSLSLSLSLPLPLTRCALAYASEQNKTHEERG